MVILRKSEIFNNADIKQWMKSLLITKEMKNITDNIK